MSESVTLQNSNYGWFDMPNFSWWHDTIQFVRIGNLPIIMRSRVFLCHYFWDVFPKILVFNLSPYHWFLRSHYFNQRLIFIVVRILFTLKLIIFRLPVNIDMSHGRSLYFIKTLLWQLFGKWNCVWLALAAENVLLFNQRHTHFCIIWRKKMGNHSFLWE